MTKTIDLTPSWKWAAQMYATALRDGTDKGQEMAYAEIVRMGQIIDDLQTELTKLKPLQDLQTDGSYARWSMTDLKAAMGMANFAMSSCSIKLYNNGKPQILAGNADIEISVEV